ncbi:ATP-dependent zinc metalloprotease FtsH [compost metagenome]
MQYARAINILSENRDKLDALAQKLLEKEVIFREDLEEIFGKRAWDPELTEKPVSSLDNPADAGNVLNTES